MPIFEYGETELRHLQKMDGKLGAAIEKIGMIERQVIPDLFCALNRNIISQQISSQAAATVWTRFQNYFGQVTPEALNTAAVDDIQRLGMSRRKAGYIKNIARAAVAGEIDLPQLCRLTDDEIIKTLVSLPGIGRWTAEMLMIFSLQRPDIVSWNDLAIRRGMKNLYGLNELSRSQFDKYRNRYSPYGSVASLYLWEISRENRT